VSIHPSDSISQARAGSQVSQTRSRVSLLPTIQTQPAIRPQQYPFEVLWNLEDCQRDPDIDIQDSNKSRPSMDRAIRHPDGTMISDSEWSAIKASARRIANELSALPDTSRQSRMRKTKTFYRTHHAREWTNAIMRLEAEQPHLRLCSSNWKADHVLGNSLIAIASKDSYVKRNKKKQKNKGKEREGGNLKMVNNNSTDWAGSGIGGESSGNGHNGGVEASSSKLFFIMKFCVST
jgi:hypothetical protein